LMGLSAFDAPHLFILDEPTNHLDIDSRQALIEALNSFEGAVILISHDRHLIDACADRLWLVDQGTVQPYDGDLDDYRAQATGRAVSGSNDKGEADKVSKADRRRENAKKRAALEPLAKQIKAAEAALEKARKRIEAIEATMADPELYTRDPAKVTALAKERADLTNAIDENEEKWLLLSSEYEDALAEPSN